MRGSCGERITAITVMTFNVWYGGGQVEFDRTGEAIRASGADVVGVQEPDGQLRRIGEERRLPRPSRG